MLIFCFSRSASQNTNWIRRVVPIKARNNVRLPANSTNTFRSSTWITSRKYATSYKTTTTPIFWASCVVIRAKRTSSTRSRSSRHTVTPCTNSQQWLYTNCPSTTTTTITISWTATRARFTRLALYPHPRPPHPTPQPWHSTTSTTTTTSPRCTHQPRTYMMINNVKLKLKKRNLWSCWHKAYAMLNA